jgi:hypothetical protein
MSKLTGKVAVVITGQGVSPFFEARRERLTAFQVLACKIMPETVAVCDD